MSQTAANSNVKTSASGYDLTPPSAEEIERLAQKLTPGERHILLDHGTETPFCGVLLDNKEKGNYVCRLCGLPLFRSGDKFHSGTGWPSFYQPFDKDAHPRARRPLAWHGPAPRSAAPAATATSATSSPTAPRRRENAIA